MTARVHHHSIYSLIQPQHNRHNRTTTTSGVRNIQMALKEQHTAESYLAEETPSCASTSTMAVRETSTFRKFLWIRGSSTHSSDDDDVVDDSCCEVESELTADDLSWLLLPPIPYCSSDDDKKHVRQTGRPTFALFASREHLHQRPSPRRMLENLIPRMVA